MPSLFHRWGSPEIITNLESEAAMAEQFEYRVAFTKEDGGFDVVETFLADSDDTANEHAEQHYEGQEWFVLDAAGNNINGECEPFDPVRDGWVGKNGLP